jgi:hypothetical protein
MLYGFNFYFYRQVLGGKNQATIERALALKFALAYYPDLPWIRRILLG